MFMNQILMLGECMIELTQSSDKNQFKQSFAGDVFNTGVYMKRCLKQSSQVSFLSVIGKDRMSKQLLNFMNEEQLDSSFLYHSQIDKMGLYMVNVDHDGERSFEYWREHSAARQLMKHIKQDTNKERFNSVDTLFFSGISIAILPTEELSEFWEVIESFKSSGCKVIFDPNYRPILWSSPQKAKEAFEMAYSLSDIVLPGVDDHKELYNHQSVIEVARHLEAIGVNEIIIKNGKEGVFISVDGERLHIDIAPVANVVDTTSAGDAFNGGYLSARQAGKSVKNSVIYASKVAACVIQHKGAIVPKACFSTEIIPLI